MFTPTDLVVVFLPFPHYRGGYYLKPVASRLRNPKTATSLCLLHALSCTFTDWSEYFCRLRKWESPSPHPSISVAFYHTRRIDAKMHKSQTCTLPINSIMGIDEAKPLKIQCFQGFSLSLVKILHRKLIQNVKRSRQALKRFNDESLSVRSGQHASDSKVNRCYEAWDCIRFTDCIQFTSCQVQSLYTFPQHHHSNSGTAKQRIYNGI